MHGGLRFLLASCGYGQLDQLPWQRKSLTKQQVARQPSPDAPTQASLFEGLAPEELGGLEAIFSEAPHLDIETFVIAHSLDPVSRRSQLVLGRSYMGTGGRAAWHWRHDLLGLPPIGGEGRIGDVSPRPDPGTEPDASVRLRRPVTEERDVQDGKGQ